MNSSRDLWRDDNLVDSAAETYVTELPETANELPEKKPSKYKQWKNKQRLIYLYFVLALVFLRFSMFSELIAYIFRTDTFILYFVGLPALYLAFSTGGFRRTFKNRCAIYYLCFVAWIVLAIPFSSWRAGSIHEVSPYLKVNAIMCPIIGGLACRWDEIKKLLLTLAVTCGLCMVFGFLFPGDWSGRRGLAFGLVANPNDYAAHLLLLLPFLLWIVLDAKRPIAIRLIACAFVGLGVYLILGTGSRGGLTAMLLGCCFFFLKATKPQRRIMLALVPVAVLIMLSVVPAENLRRAVSFSKTAESEHDGAEESKELRQFLLTKSIDYSLSHPLFGVGPGQFPTYVGMHEGKQSAWRSTHNSFTQISSECGLPALGFYLAALLSAFGVLGRIYRSVARVPEWRDITSTVVCVMLGFVAHFIAVSFLNFGYLFHVPALIGLVCAISYSARREIRRRLALRHLAPQSVSPLEE